MNVIQVTKSDDLPYNPTEFQRVATEFRQRNITKVIVKTDMLWKMQTNPNVVRALEEALLRVARKAGFTCVMKEPDDFGKSEVITFYRPSDPDYQAFLQNTGKVYG